MPKVNQNVEHHSIFISFSSNDREFAERLYKDLEEAGVKCWFSPEDMRTGERIRVALDSAVLEHNKLLIVLSRSSINSDWVEQEVETAFEKERESGTIVLFPIMIDNEIFELKKGWAAHIKRTRHIGDFRNKDDEALYQKSVQKILRDLKTGS